MIIRRYLLTETPGIATGYWKAMKRPAWERSSGSASVMSSPLKMIVPSVTSQRRVAHDHVGERRLAGAVGPHQGVDLALLDVEVEPVEDLLVLDAHVQVAYLQLSHFAPFLGFRGGDYAALPSAAAAALVAERRELDQLGQRRARRAPW